MRIVRLFAPLIFLVGLLYFLPGVLALVVSFLSRDELRELAQYSNGSIPPTLPLSAFLTLIAYTLLGALVIVSSLGILVAREWARKLWLGISIVVGALNLFEFIKHYTSQMIEPLDWLGFGFIIAVIGASWYLLTRSRIVNHFKRVSASESSA